MDRKTTPEIDEMERVIEEGRQAYRDNATLDSCPHGQQRLRGYWRIGWFQVRDQENQ